MTGGREVVLGNGLIGRHLHYRLRDSILLTRKEVDLSNEVGRGSWDIPKCSVAYICMGETSTSECEEHSKETRLVNVLNTVRLAKQLRPARVLWISSERVFDGSVPYRKVSDSVCPMTEYGRQKAEAEGLLLDLGVTVVRFSKVLGWDVPLFEGWISRLRNNEFIYPSSNMSMSPIPVSFAVQVLLGLGEGLFQVSGTQDVRYSQIAYHIANYLGRDLSLVQPVLTNPHPWTTLESNIPGIDGPDSWEVLQEWCRNRLLARAQ